MHVQVKMPKNGKNKLFKDNQFNWIYFKNKTLFLHLLIQFQNLHAVLNIPKKKLCLIA